jgi:hypothetical protein
LVDESDVPFPMITECRLIVLEADDWNRLVNDDEAFLYRNDMHRDEEDDDSIDYILY